VSQFVEHLIAKIHPEVSPLWAVADSDGLFRSDEVARLLTTRGVEILVYDDPMAFRFRYEHEVRPRLESGDPVCYVIVVDPGNNGLRSLPADIYLACHQSEIALGDLFPSLSRKVLRELEPAVLSGLWDKKHQFPGNVLSERDTADLVLRLAYRIEPAFLNSLQDLVQILVGIHFAGTRLPDVLADRLEQIAGPLTGQMVGLRELIRNPGAFWQFLQARWERWLIPPTDSNVQEFVSAEISFEESQLRVWMDNLFFEGLLKPLETAPARLPHPWCEVGVAKKDGDASVEELAAMRRRLAGEIPETEAGYKDWLHFAHRYSTHVASSFSRDQDADETAAFWNDLWTPVNERFGQFVRSHLESLCNLPPTRPVLAHHIARFLARRVSGGTKVALLVLDGLSLSQWRIVRGELERVLPALCISDDACFTMAPSVTNVARQCIYSGELPVFFEATIDRTDLDAKRWKIFWDSAIGRPVRSAHINIEGVDTDFTALEETIDKEAAAVGITVRMPDEIVHGATMGWRGLTGQISLWARQSFLSNTIKALLDAGYELYLTADHGNLESVGGGTIPQGVLVERSGQRVRIYRDPTIFEHTAVQLGARVEQGSSKMLPPSYLPLIHSGRGAFVTSGQTIVTHGGTSIDEMVIPFIQLSKTSRP
jgi:hypothetical protein